MTTKTAAAPQALHFGQDPRDRFPGLGDAVGRLARTLAVTAARRVTITDVAVEQVHAAALSAQDTYWFGGTHGAVVGVRRDRASVLAELLLGMAPDPTARPLSQVETTLLRTGFVPLTAATTNTLRALEFAPDLSEHTGEAVLAALGKNTVLTAITATVTAHPSGAGTAEDEAAGTVACEVVLAVAAPSRSGNAEHRADLDDLRSSVADIPLAVRVCLPPTRVTTRALTGLASGDLLVLAATTDTPWLVYVGDALVAAGGIGQSNNRRSVHIDMTWRANPMNEQILTGLAAAQTAVSGAPGEKPQADNFGLLGNVTVEVAAELGRVELPLRDVAALHAGQVLELDKAPDSPFAVVVNGVAIATAEAVVVDGHVGLKIIDLIG